MSALWNCETCLAGKKRCHVTALQIKMRVRVLREVEGCWLSVEGKQGADAVAGKRGNGRRSASVPTLRTYLHLCALCCLTLF